jgi:predicted RNase H-like HicB family nuclease
MRRYLIVIDKAEGNYCAYSPDLPGCVAAGDTAEETKQLMLEAMEMHLKCLQEDGLPLPQPASMAEYVTV